MCLLTKYFLSYNRDTDLTVIMTTHTFEELKPRIDEALKYLETCDDFTTNTAQESLKVLQQASYREMCSDRLKVAMHLVGEGFGLNFFVKMWTSLCEYLEREKWEQRGFKALERLTCCYHNYTDVCPELGAELGKNSCIPFLFQSLEKLKMYFNKTAEFKIIRNVVSDIFGILYNSIRLNSSNREIYRKLGASDCLKEYLKQPFVATDALMILAYIVNEHESKILAESDVGVVTLVQLLKLALLSSNHVAVVDKSTGPQLQSKVCTYNYYSAIELLDCLNHLAINDVNKREIEKQGGIPVIVSMLQDDFTEEEQTIAAEALWNLAFIESIRQSEELQVALTSKKTT